MVLDVNLHPYSAGQGGDDDDEEEEEGDGQEEIKTALDFSKTFGENFSFECQPCRAE